ncbi:hypothetical protein C5167_045176 [Papaver somniferum]|uniref:Uncharacterized protein n=1 Tax=Papaver somniferum TaxID=3469 RepID=A0A4Y7LCL3_PAPSO|nr:hypothetical protein C5167_045176 [Papaver somniferum]
MAPPAKIPPPLQLGWRWGVRDVQVQPNAAENVTDDIDYEDDKSMIEYSNDDIYADASDESQKSHETRTKNK